MKKIDANISGAVEVKQPVSQVSKIETLNYLMVRKNHRDLRGDREKLHRSVLSVYSVVKKTMQQFLISGKIKKSQIFGSEHQNPRVPAQSAAYAFPFRFDEYYFINPNNQNFNSPQRTQSLAAFSLRTLRSLRWEFFATPNMSVEINPKELLHKKLHTFYLESKNLIDSRCDYGS